MLDHGGQLRAAAAHYGIPLEQWLDLSTGINPHAYVPPIVADDLWSRLPQENDGLELAAAGYYGTHDVLPVPGSQAAIQALPRLRAPSRVAVLTPGYAEHAHAWRKAGHRVLDVAAHDVDAAIDDVSVLVVIQPNNPTGASFAHEQLRAWHRKLAARGGWLVVDEAFIEATPLDSLVEPSMPAGLILLRSLGKFFGLPGARVGFVLADATVRGSLRELLGPWALPGPSRHVAQTALRDHAWQAQTRARLQGDGARLERLLRGAGLSPSGGCALFQWVEAERAELLHQRLAQRGILTRYFSDPRSLRFGLPGAEHNWQRLAAALAEECAG